VKNEIKLEEVHSEEWIERIAYFRVEVWNLNGMVDMSYFPERKCLEAVDSEAIHRIAQWQGRLIAATRYTQYADLQSTHHGDYYGRAGIELQGPIGIPEHTVVHPEFAGRGLGKAITESHVAHALKFGVRFNISENTLANAEMMHKMGVTSRKSLGRAPPDPRFPGIQFEWIALDVEAYRRNLKSKG